MSIDSIGRAILALAIVCGSTSASAQADEPSRPTSAPTTRPVSPAATSAPTNPRPPRRRPSLAGTAGDGCTRNADCRKGLRCDDQLCVPDFQRPAVILPVKKKRAKALQTRRGTMTVGGSLGFEYQSIQRDRGDAISGFKLNFFPRFGLFVVEDLVLDFGMGIGSGFGQLYEASPTSITFTVGLRYLFGSGRLRPYLGMSIGPEFLVPTRGDAAVFFDISVPVGLLISLNQYAALDLGLAFRAAIDVSDQGFSTIWMPFGLLGVQVFF